MSDVTKTHRLDREAYSIYNIEACPECGATKWATFSGPGRTWQMGCDECDHIPEGQGALVLMAKISPKNVEAHKQFTKQLFQLWNDSVAKANGAKPKKVRARLNKEGVKLKSK